MRYSRKEGLCKTKIPESMLEWKNEIVNDNNEMKDWMEEAIVKCEDGFVALSEIIQKFKLEKPYEKNAKVKDLERMVNSFFNTRGIYLKDRHRPVVEGERKEFRRVYSGYKLKM